MIKRSECSIQAPVMIEDGPGAVDIQGSAEFPGHSPEIHIFAVKRSVTVLKRMHGESVTVYPNRARDRSLGSAGMRPAAAGRLPAAL